MHIRLLNSFNLLGAILLSIGLYGLASGGKMVFDPGRLPRGNEWFIYALAGALMVVNGFLPPAHEPRNGNEKDADKNHG